MFGHPHDLSFLVTIRPKTPLPQNYQNVMDRLPWNSLSTFIHPRRWTLFISDTGWTFLQHHPLTSPFHWWVHGAKNVFPIWVGLIWDISMGNNSFCSEPMRAVWGNIHQQPAQNPAPHENSPVKMEPPQKIFQMTYPHNQWNMDTDLVTSHQKFPEEYFQA